MRIIKYEPSHFMSISRQQMQNEAEFMNTEDAESLAKSGPSISIEVDGKIIACGGISQIWLGRWVMWALLSEEAGKHMVGLVRAGKRLMMMQPINSRLEAQVRSDFTAAHDLVKLLGFNWHHHEEKFFPGGIDADVYVRFA